MSSVTLKSKLNPPLDNSDSIYRDNLATELEGITKRKLTLASAPAGYGKTKILSQWYNQFKDSNHIVCWLTLDENDNDQRVLTDGFIESISAAIDLNELDRMNPESGDSSAVDLINRLLNLIAETKKDFVIFIDNYQLLKTPEAINLTQYITLNLPANAHLVVASRYQGGWSIHKLLIENELKIISKTRLRFSIAEATDFVHLHKHIKLQEHQIISLHRNCHGWPAAIKLAAIALQNAKTRYQEEDIVAGNFGLLVKYVEQNVIEKLELNIQCFLINTAHLERLHPTLCNYVCDIDNALEKLQYLEKHDLVTSLEDYPDSYEYSANFSGFFKHLSALNAGPNVKDIHKKASEWFTLNELPKEALHHALAIDDYEQAIKIVEHQVEDLLLTGDTDILIQLFKRLPEHYITEKPYILYPYIWALLITQYYKSAQEQLTKLKDLLENSEIASPTPRIFPTASQLKILEYRLRQALDPNWSNPSTWENLKTSQADDDYFPREQISLAQAGAYLRKDQLEEAYATFMDAGHYAELSNTLITSIITNTKMSQIRFIQGQLNHAKELCDKAINICEERNKKLVPITGITYFVRSAINYELNHLVFAEEDLLKSLLLFKQYNNSIYSVRAQFLTARLACQHSGPKAGLEVLDNVDKEPSLSRFNFLLTQLRAEQSYYHILGNELPVAEAILRNQGLPIDKKNPSPNFKCDKQDEQIYLTLCHFFIASGYPEKASAWLTKMLHQAESAGRLRFCTQISAMLCLAHDLEEDERRTLRTTRQMLRFGEKTGCIRSILDPSPRIIPLLKHYQKIQAEQESEPNEEATNVYLEGLIDIYEGTKQSIESRGTASSPKQSKNSSKEPCALTARESEILLLICEGHSNKSIAGELLLGEGTVKWHIKNIYSKLYVNSRTQAVAVAHNIGLVR